MKRLIYETRNLSSIVGQPGPKRIVADILKSGLYPKAILFDGPPGVGKTALGHCLFYGLNCEMFDVETMKICGQCDSCRIARYGRDVYRAPLVSLNDKKIASLRNAVRFGPAYKVRLLIIEEVHFWTFKEQDRFLAVIEECGQKNLILLNATLDRNNDSLNKERFLEAFESRCRVAHFSYLSKESIRKLIKRITKSMRVSISEAQIHEIETSAEGSGRRAVDLLFTLISRHQSKRISE